MASTSLAHAPKAVREQAAQLARTASAKTRSKLQHANRIKVPVFVTLGATVLGLTERFAGIEPDELGVDNGVVAGIPIALAGAFLPGKLGEATMLAGIGLLASGARTTARELGSGPSAAETEGL